MIVSFLSRDTKGMDCDEREGEDDFRAVRGQEAIITTHCMKKII